MLTALNCIYYIALNLGVLSRSNLNHWMGVLTGKELQMLFVTELMLLTVGLSGTSSSFILGSPVMHSIPSPGFRI